MEKRYHECITSKGVSKIVLNITEYLIEKSNSKNYQQGADKIADKQSQQSSTTTTTTSSQLVSFWLRLSLAYHESIDAQNMDRSLLLLGLFYASNGKPNSAEQLYTQAILKLEKKQDMSYTLMMGKNLLGRLLLASGEKRKDEAHQHLSQSEKLANILPHWWADLDHLYI